MGNNYNEKIDEYNQLFPKMKLPTGKKQQDHQKVI